MPAYRARSRMRSVSTASQRASRPGVMRGAVTVTHGAERICPGGWQHSTGMNEDEFGIIWASAEEDLSVQGFDIDPGCERRA